jgi:hypothetical protein
MVHGLKRQVRITHPFHPLFSQTFELLLYRRTQSYLKQVHLRDESGRMFVVPVSWTDAGEEDPFLHISAGRSYFHMRDLPRLVDLIKEVVKSNADREACK